MGTSNCFVVISHKAAKIADQGQIKFTKWWMNKQLLTNILAKTIYPYLACLARQRSNCHPSLTLGRCQDLQLSISHNHQNCWGCLSFAWDDYRCNSPDLLSLGCLGLDFCAPYRLVWLALTVFLGTPSGFRLWLEVHCSKHCIWFAFWRVELSQN